MITRPRNQAGEMKRLLEQAGAAAFVFPTVEILPLEDYREIDALLLSPAGYDWLLLTSANGVAMLQQRAAALGLSLAERFASAQVAAVGPKTAAALEAAGLRVDLIPPVYDGDALAAALIARGVAGRRLLALRSEIAREALILQLRAAGAEVTDLPIYNTGLPALPDIAAAETALRRGEIDVVTFTSASAVHNFSICFAGRLPQLLERTRIACIGPVTAESARQLLGRVDLEAAGATVAELVVALLGPGTREVLV
ncbi:MAG: uroporphyrinogen-III synthase [Candidatus Sericytochromatia bacterium]